MTLAAILEKDDSPCRDCPHASMCRVDGFECRAFRNWVGAAQYPQGKWRPEQRTRPETICQDSAAAERAFQAAQRKWYRRTRARVEVQLAASERSDEANIVARAVNVMLASVETSDTAAITITPMKPAKRSNPSAERYPCSGCGRVRSTCSTTAAVCGPMRRICRVAVFDEAAHVAGDALATVIQLDGAMAGAAPQRAPPGSKSGSGGWSHCEEIGWVHSQEIGGSHS